MGVSFKVARTGSRYRPRPPALPEIAGNVPDERGETPEESRRGGECIVSDKEDPEAGFVGVGNGNNSSGLEHEASFSLNLFPAGFSIGKPYEGKLSPLLQDVPKLLHPYDKASMTLFSAIEHGLLPGDALDDIPCKYLNGTIVCEVWDYRNYVSQLEVVDSPRDFPKFQKTCLRMCMENVVKDMLLISDDSWTYKDLLEAESHIIKTLQPALFLDPNPSMERLCRTPVLKKLDLGITHQKSKKKHQDAPPIDAKYTDLFRGSNISAEVAFGQSISQTCAVSIDGAIACSQHAISRSTANMEHSGIENNVLTHASGISSQVISTREHFNTTSVAKTVAVASKSASIFNQDSRDSNVDLRKRHNSQCLPKHMLKKPKQEPLDLESHQLIMSKRLSMSEHDLQIALPEHDLQIKSTPLLQKLKAEKIKHVKSSSQRYPQMEISEPICEMPKLACEIPSSLDTKGVECRAKEEHTETRIAHGPQVEKDKVDDPIVIGIEKANQLSALSLTRSHFPPHVQWSNPIPSIEKNHKKDDSSRKRKSSQVSQASAQRPVCSALSSKLNEPSSISSRIPCKTCPTGEASELQKENAPARTVAACIILEHNDSLLKENHMSLPTKWKVNSLKASSPSMNATGSPRSVSGTNVPISTVSSSVRNLPNAMPPTETKCDPAFLERFSRIALVTDRYRLNYKKHKEDQYFKKRLFSHSPRPLVDALESEDADENRNCFDQMCTSKCHFGWNNNVHKSRILTFSYSKFLYPRTDIPCIYPRKLVLSESKQPHVHLVEVQIVFGDEQSMHIALLPNTQYADVFAAQFTSLMKRDGYELVDDQFLPLTASSFNSSGGPSASHSFQVFRLPCSAPISHQSMNKVAPVYNRMSTWKRQWFPCQHNLSPGRLLPRAYNLSTPRQLDIADCISSMNPAQRSVLADKNSLGGGDMQIDSQMHSGPANLQPLQLHRHQLQKYQRHDIMQRKVAGLFASTDVSGTGGYISDLNFSSRINEGQFQMCGSNNFNRQFQTGGLSQAQLAVFANLRRGSCQGLCGMRISNEFLSGQSPSTCMRDHFHRRGTFSMDMPEVSSSNSATNNNELSQQSQQQQHRLQSPHRQLGSPTMTQLSQPTQASPRQLNSEPAPKRVSTSIVNLRSPEISTQRVVSDGSSSSTSSPMKFQCLHKENSSGNAGLREGE